MHVFLKLIEAAERRAGELRDDIPHLDDRSAPIVENQINDWEKLARDGRAALDQGALVR